MKQKNTLIIFFISSLFGCMLLVIKGVSIVFVAIAFIIAFILFILLCKLINYLFKVFNIPRRQG